jgi:hypothetical protein
MTVFHSINQYHLTSSIWFQLVMSRCLRQTVSLRMTTCISTRPPAVECIKLLRTFPYSSRSHSMPSWEWVRYLLVCLVSSPIEFLKFKCIYSICCAKSFTCQKINFPFLSLQVPTCARFLSPSVAKICRSSRRLQKVKTLADATQTLRSYTLIRF